MLPYPVVAVNNALTKHMFDNRYGTGQSTLDGIIRATNVLLAGRTLVVVGYGWCGRGIASRAAGMGAHVVVTEVDPRKAIEALMDGYRVMPMSRRRQDRRHLRDRHRQLSRDPRRALQTDEGRRDRLQLGPLQRRARPRRHQAHQQRHDVPRNFVEQYELHDGRKICILADGRLVNLRRPKATRRPVMDMSFANQAMAAGFIAQNHKTLEKKVYDVPLEIDEEVATLKLSSMGVEIDVLTPEQVKYMASWSEGT